ncbi:MAG: 30S ribosomal protein S17 [Thermodesulfobacteriaceae bacterium]|nr:30S ribosomal protein S17 [Thermodesulfobacteriaceae bacterium]MCX8040973.1 30S ribosomal protein S17 [Thermodesulfobacteriaceae bacterium]MDW8135577.1 30S ribosomal protein S17 [Thermodesulfobacterium sp.]
MNKRKRFVGMVVSDRMDKTVVVMVETLVKHPLYGKYIKRRKKYMAHDERNECKIGDKVLIEETRPLSRRKRWRVKEILERGKRLEEVEEL